MGAGAPARRRTDPPLPPGRRGRRKVLTRKGLIQAGRDLFGEKGVYEPRVEDLTRRAGIAKGTYYRYFAGKEDLILAVVDQGFADLSALMAARVEGARSLRAAVRRILLAHSDFFVVNPDLMRIFHQMRGMLKFNCREWRPMRRTLQAHIVRIAALLGRTREGESLGSPRRAAVATLILGAISGAMSVRASLHRQAAVRRLPGETIAALTEMALTSAAGCRPERSA